MPQTCRGVRLARQQGPIGHFRNFGARKDINSCEYMFLTYETDWDVRVLCAASGGHSRCPQKPLRILPATLAS